MELDVKKYIERKANNLTETFKGKDGTTWVAFKKYNEITGEIENETPATEVKIEELELRKTELDNELVEKKKEVDSEKADIDEIIVDLKALQ